MNRRIVLLGPYPPPYGGVSIYIKKLFDVLAERGVELWTYGDEQTAAPNVFFMKDKRRELLPLLIRRGSKAIIADCTHFLFEYPSFIVPIWVFLKRLLGFEWIKIVQDGSLPSRFAKFNPIRKELFRLAAQEVSEFIVVSEDLENWLRKEIGVKQQVTLIKNLFPVSYRAEEMVLPQIMEASLNPYWQRSKRVCSIGVFIPSYGFKHVTQAVERIRQDMDTDIGLLLLDGDFAADEAYRSEVLQGKDWITVLKNVPHPSVLEILKRSDVFVRAFGLESYGLSRVEAIWSGIPVVATRAGETRGMLLYDFGNIDQLTGQLNQALSAQTQDERGHWADIYQREAEENLAALVRRLFSGCEGPSA
ncbi:MAG TPA: glycosyltransferase family 4 protein [Pyrinomonadaceae bacterium]|nr:glycosyltransferase family 4 protein [Pyrinomonadaceae bacterium]